MADPTEPFASTPAVIPEEAPQTAPRSLSTDIESDVPGKIQAVSREEVEDFLSLAVRIFLQGGAYLHAQTPGYPEVEVKLSDDTLVVNVRRLDQALAWRLSQPDEVKPPHPEPLFSRWRVLVKVDDSPVAALGRGIPGVQVRTGHASFLLFKDFVKGLIEDKSGFRRAREAEAERERLQREIEHSRERADAISECDEVEVEPGEEALPGPQRFGPDVYERVIDEERESLRTRYR